MTLQSAPRAARNSISRSPRAFSPSSVFLWLILALAAHLQFTAVLKTEVIAPVRADAADYVSYAYNLKHHAVYSRAPTWHPDWRGGEPLPDAVRSPGYPLFLLALTSGEPTPTFVLNVEMAQAALAVLTVALSFFLARLFLPPSLACVSALLVAVTPHLVTASTYLLSEGLFAFALVAGLLCMAQALRSSSRSVTWIVASGFLLGAAALIRPTLLYAPLVLLPGLWLLSERSRRNLVVLGFGLAFVATQAPWMIRNEIILGRPTDPTLMIGTLHHGSYPGFLYDDRPETFGYPYRFDPRTKEITSSMKRILQHIASEFGARPMRMLRWYLLEKPVYFFWWEPIQGMGDVFIYPVRASPYFSRPEFLVSHGVMKVLHWPLIFLGFAGSLLPWFGSILPNLARWQIAGLRMISVFVFFVIAVHIAGAPFPRYSVPLRPLTWLFAVLALEALWRAIRTRAVNAAPRPAGTT